MFRLALAYCLTFFDTAEENAKRHGGVNCCKPLFSNGELYLVFPSAELTINPNSDLFCATHPLDTNFPLYTGLVN